VVLEPVGELVEGLEVGEGVEGVGELAIEAQLRL
jgi:hypothetical protein